MYKKVLFLIALGILLVGMVGIVSGEFTMLPHPKEPIVYPPEGNWSDCFNYSVEIMFDKEIDVDLLVWDPWLSDWVCQNTTHYKNKEHLERIYWNGTKPFSKECEGMQKFKFTWNETDLKIREKGKLTPLIGRGPYIKVPPPTVEFKNGNVSYKRNATYKTEFNYSIEVNTSKAVDIELMVYDPCLGIWKSIGRIKVSTSGKQNLSWKKRSFIETKCKKGTSQFQFIAHYKGERVNESEIYEGPSLIPLLEFRNPKVYPSPREYEELFNYSVEIVNVTECVILEEIKLEVLNPHNLTWMTFNQTNSTNNTLIWHVRPFKGDPECEGTARYRFRYDDDVWPEVVPCYGPEIIPPPPRLEGWANSTIPERGNFSMEYYVPTDDMPTGYITPFNFTATSKNTDIDLELLIRDPVTGNLERRGGPQHCEAGENVTWSHIKPFDSISVDKIENYIEKRFNFTFMYGGNIYEEDFQGPELVVAFDNPEYPDEVIYGEHFNFSVDVIASRNLSINLTYRNKGNWTDEKGINNNPREYTNNRTRQTLVWNCTALYSWDAFKFVWWNERDPALENINMLSFSRALGIGKNSDSIITVKPKLEEVKITPERCEEAKTEKFLS